MKMNESVLEEKSSLMALGLSLSSKLDWCSYIISIAFKKTGALIRSMKGLEWNTVISGQVLLAAIQEIRNVDSFSLFYRY